MNLALSRWLPALIPPANRSLHLSISRALVVTIVFVLIIAGSASFLFAFLDAQEIQDDTLSLIASVAAKWNGPMVLHGDTSQGDEASQVLVGHLRTAALPAWVPSDLRPGFQTREIDGREWRILVGPDRLGQSFMVAQSTRERWDLAWDSAWRTIIPLGLLLPLLLWLTRWIVVRETAPIRKLAEHLDAYVQEPPSPLSTSGIPSEIIPFLEAINAQIERIKRLLDEQRRFIAIAAHELRSPLTALSLQAQNIQGAPTPEAMRERVDPLMAGIERSRHLLEQLMNHAQAQASLMDLVEVDVVDVLRMVVNGRIEIANCRGIAIDFAWDDSSCCTRNRTGLRLIAENAVDNAIRYSPAGETVTIRGGPCRAGFYFEVSDAGPGIPEAERSNVFQPFYRIMDLNDGGSGLGLAIAKEAATRSGGRIVLSQVSESGGLVFRYEEDQKV